MNEKTFFSNSLCVFILLGTALFILIDSDLACGQEIATPLPAISQQVSPALSGGEEKFNVGDRRWNGLAWEYYTPGYWKLNELRERVWVKSQWSYYWVPESIWRSGYVKGRHEFYPGYWQSVKYANYNWVDHKRRNNGDFASGHLQRYIEFRDPRIYK